MHSTDWPKGGWKRRSRTLVTGTTMTSYSEASRGLRCATPSRRTVSHHAMPPRKFTGLQTSILNPAASIARLSVVGVYRRQWPPPGSNGPYTPMYPGTQATTRPRGSTHDAKSRSAPTSCVEPGGRVVVWVPGYMALYGQFDREVGHCRRYT